MIILALDTTRAAGSCALADEHRLLREEASDGSQPPASRLPGDLASLLRLEGIGLPDVDVYAVAAGPGSFTGLRVGIATMQGLAMASGKPLVGVSALDALHARANAERVAAWIDAWRGEVFAALYEHGRQTTPPVVARPDELLEGLGAAPALFIGDGAAEYHGRIRAALGGRATFADPVSPPLAGTIAQLAARTVLAGQRPPPHAIRPIYVRRSDAERARDGQCG
jgi:tRNA threonylcarbamoyladenosine biosynthesis protein TsaB